MRNYHFPWIRSTKLRNVPTCATTIWIQFLVLVASKLTIIYMYLLMFDDEAAGTANVAGTDSEVVVFNFLLHLSVYLIFFLVSNSLFFFRFPETTKTCTCIGSGSLKKIIYYIAMDVNNCICSVAENIKY
jgi:hypothetical protein